MQDANEPFEQFLTDLKLLVKNCGYTEQDEHVRDRIVIGCKSSKLRQKLIQEGSDLTLEKAIDIAITMEQSQIQLKTMKGEDPSVFKMHDWKEELEINGKKAAFIGQCSQMPYDTYKSLDMKDEIKSTQSQLKSYSGHVIGILGCDWKEELEINGKKAAFIGQCSQMPYDTYKSLDMKDEIKSTQSQLKSYSGHVIGILGCDQLTCKHKDKSLQIKCYI
ncbi:predicted protein [Nematostella vectensis]|uniref:Uncharacterized protein n=1 Tax=Nematostella vectensis TaxID=45351 RepID=A7SZ69_NEMVE|nr:predicted protein [Nematostella vectensis]|eukprot:XP_001623095.1 predicted protein [Nematostella vectensis]